MALLTGKGMENILKRIMETGGLTESMERDIQRLKDDFDEREGILRRYGETYDGEDEEQEEYEYRENESTDRSQSGDDTDVFTPKEEDVLGEGSWESRYRDLERRYIDRFFKGVPTEENARAETERIISDQTEDVLRDGSPQSFDELLYRVEGV